MPTYQYACTDCGEQLEVVQKFTDEALTVCPACDGRLRKVYSAVGVVFKGSGFYRTDSRNGSDGSNASSNGSAKTAPERSGDAPAAANGSAGDGAAGKGTSGSGTSSRTAAKEATAAA